MELLFVLSVWVVCGFLCYKLAEAKNRDPGVAAVCGFFFALFALIYYCAVPKLEVEEK